MQAFKKKINLTQISEFRPFTEETKNMARLYHESVSGESLNLLLINQRKKTKREDCPLPPKNYKEKAFFNESKTGKSELVI